jgi:prefoldin subunit 5
MEMNIIEQNRALQALVEKLDREVNEIDDSAEKYTNYIAYLIKFIEKNYGSDVVNSITKEYDNKNGGIHFNT